MADDLPPIHLTHRDMDRLLTLVYPGRADIDSGRIPVLTRRRRYRVAALPYQPEAGGDVQ